MCVCVCVCVCVCMYIYMYIYTGGAFLSLLPLVATGATRARVALETFGAFVTGGPLGASRALLADNALPASHTQLTKLSLHKVKV
jgi:hypothetical protein